MREFSLGILLTSTTGMTLCNFSDFQEMAGYLLGRSVFTHELLDEADNIQAIILDQHPALAGVKAPVLDFGGDVKAQINSYLAWIALQHGDRFELEPRPVARTEDPISSLERMMRKS